VLCALAVGCRSGLLVRHARRVLGVAADVLNKPGRPRIMKACKEVCTDVWQRGLSQEDTFAYNNSGSAY
jgi:hypothetical protein